MRIKYTLYLCGRSFHLQYLLLKGAAMSLTDSYQAYSVKKYYAPPVLHAVHYYGTLRSLELYFLAQQWLQVAERYFSISVAQSFLCLEELLARHTAYQIQDENDVSYERILREVKDLVASLSGYTLCESQNTHKDMTAAITQAHDCCHLVQDLFYLHKALYISKEPHAILPSMVGNNAAIALCIKNVYPLLNNDLERMRQVNLTLVFYAHTLKHAANEQLAN
ncbi:hypothetical protein COY03_01905 [bacterium CG_4_10_14_0_2_um_filter_48_144]|nr:MAG: hypothetical protein COY03_01905 [bacterium CG_4_10_14_0_2_um_filter_48_144]